MAVSACAMEQGTAMCAKGADILGNGIFECGENAFKAMSPADTNFDSVKVGSDNAFAVGIGAGFFPFSSGVGATAKNNLEIKKNQNSGECACCQALDSSCPCKDCCIKYNIEQIEVGNRNAMAIGVGAGFGPFAGSNGAVAENNIKIVTNQE